MRSCCTRSGRRADRPDRALPAPRHAATGQPAAAVAVRAPAVVPGQVPVLRLQLACWPGRGTGPRRREPSRRPCTWTRCAPTWKPALPLVWGRPVSACSSAAVRPACSRRSIDRLLGDPRAAAAGAGCEITLEANPGTFERERFRAFRAAGVTRLSIGVQSFDDACAAALGRVHDSAQARAAVEEARAAFDTFNLDLMYALPGQTLAQAASRPATALALQTRRTCRSTT
jgi:hypothetical protein